MYKKLVEILANACHEVFQEMAKTSVYEVVAMSEHEVRFKTHDTENGCMKSEP